MNGWSHLPWPLPYRGMQATTTMLNHSDLLRIKDVSDYMQDVQPH